ncbi:hypothetical protein [Ilyobacter polytropus]|nr:hypothetical protein [Ilyobacter polytropus]
MDTLKNYLCLWIITYLSEESDAKLEELYEELRLLLKFAQVESIIQDKH